MIDEHRESIAMKKYSEVTILSFRSSYSEREKPTY